MLFMISTVKEKVTLECAKTKTKSLVELMELIVAHVFTERTRMVKFHKHFDFDSCLKIKIYNQLIFS